MLTVNFSTMQRLAHGGTVWRAFDHLLAAAGDRLLLVPIGLMDGDLTQVVDGCPVPWAEVWAVLDAKNGYRTRELSPAQLAALAPLVAALLPPEGWVADIVPPGASVPTFSRVVSPHGVRLAWLGDPHA